MTTAPEPSPSPRKPTRGRTRLLVAGGLGFALALLCPQLPPDYQAACHAIASICTGGLP